jgi:hypothetical protein
MSGHFEDFCHKMPSSETRRNPRLSDPVRFGLWRGCGESGSLKPAQVSLLLRAMRRGYAQ